MIPSLCGRPRAPLPLLAGMTLALFASAGAQAAILTGYTSRAQFTAASGVLNTENFNGNSVGAKVGTTDFGAFTLADNRSPGTPNDALFRQAANKFQGSTYVGGPMYDNSNLKWYSSFSFDFDTPITEFGGEWISGNIGRIFLTIDGQQITSPSLSSTNGYFYGIKSDTPFSRVEIRVGSSYLEFDNVTYSAGATGAVPEPASWAMMIIGFGATGAALRRRRLTVRLGRAISVN
jgi:hypothetical protein